MQQPLKMPKNTTNITWNDITRDSEVHSYLSESRIEWKLIIELSLWMGGFYERLVGITKIALKKGYWETLFNSYPTTNHHHRSSSSNK